MTTEQRPDAVDEAFAAIRRMTVPDCPPDTELLETLSKGALGEAEQRFLPRQKFSWSAKGILMRTMIWSTAVTVLLALSAFLLLSGSTSIALADVIKAAEKHKLVRYTMSQCDDVKDGTALSPLVQVTYADLKSSRFRQESRQLTLNDWVENNSFVVTDGPKNVRLHVLTEVLTGHGKIEAEGERIKNSGRFPRMEASLNTAYGDFTPATAAPEKSMLENIQELEKHKDAVATKSKLNGKDVLKYRIEEEFKTTILTVDPVTKLPVKLEHEITDPKILHPTVVKMKFVFSDFEWDPDLKGKTIDELFDTTPPKGYVVEDHRK